MIDTIPKIVGLVFPMVILAFALIRYVDNGRFKKKKDCEKTVGGFTEKLSEIGERLGTIEGYLEGIYGKKVKK